MDEIEQLCNDNGIPAGLIYKAKDMIKDPHFKARNTIIDIEHPDFGIIKMQNVAPRLSYNPGQIHHVGPRLGEHNDYVLRQLLKKNEKDLESLKKEGII